MSSGGHLCAPSLVLLSFNTECTWPWVYWWHLKVHAYAHLTQTGKSCIYTHIQTCIRCIQVHTKTQVCASCTFTVGTHIVTNTYTVYANKSQTTFLVFSAPSESIWWIECLKVLQLTDGTRILNTAQKGTHNSASTQRTSAVLHTHTCTYTKAASVTKHTHLHLERQTLLCILTIWMAYA